jgi:hypothetical protein
MRAFNVPLSRHDYVQKWCCDVHNILANRKLGWRSPIERNEGSTPDISRFRFHMWEPIWYYEPSKQPKDNLRKARWLGFADSAGDEFTYLIELEEQRGPHRKVLIRSNIKTRRHNIGKETEYINDNPDLANFFLSPADQLEDSIDDPDLQPIIPDTDSGELTNTPHTDPNEPDANAILVPTLDETDDLTAIEKEFSGLTSKDMERVYDQFHTDQCDDTYSFDRIVSHSFKDGVLIFTVRYTNDGELGEHSLEVPFPIIKSDQPLSVAKYIRDNEIETKRNGFCNHWSKCTLKTHRRCIRRPPSDGTYNW